MSLRLKKRTQKLIHSLLRPLAAGLLVFGIFGTGVAALATGNSITFPSGSPGTPTGLVGADRMIDLLKLLKLLPCDLTTPSTCASSGMTRTELLNSVGTTPQTDVSRVATALQSICPGTVPGCSWIDQLVELFTNVGKIRDEYQQYVQTYCKDSAHPERQNETLCMVTQNGDLVTKVNEQFKSLQEQTAIQLQEMRNEYQNYVTTYCAPGAGHTAESMCVTLANAVSQATLNGNTAALNNLLSTAVSNLQAQLTLQQQTLTTDYQNYVKGYCAEAVAGRSSEPLCASTQQGASIAALETQFAGMQSNLAEQINRLNDAFNAFTAGLSCTANDTRPACNWGAQIASLIERVANLEKVPSVCGNKALEGTEECDDGNTTGGDGCSSVCKKEGGYVASCGNGVMDPGEACELVGRLNACVDGNGNPGIRFYNCTSCQLVISTDPCKTFADIPTLDNVYANSSTHTMSTGNGALTLNTGSGGLNVTGTLTVTGGNIVGTVPVANYATTAGDAAKLNGVAAGNFAQLSGTNTWVNPNTFSQPIVGNVTGTAANVTGTVAIGNGGTGAATAAGGRTNLGLGGLAVLNAVDGNTITDGSIATADLGANSVDSGKIADNTVSTTDILNGTILPADLSIGNYNGIFSGTGYGISITGSAASATTATTAGNVTGIVAIGNGGTGGVTAVAARTNLGLGGLATLNSVSPTEVSIGDYSGKMTGPGIYAISISGSAASATTAGGITGQGSLATLNTINNGNWSGTALAIGNGGTGGTTAAGARTNLGLGPLSTLGTTNISQLSNDSGYLTSLNGVTSANITDGTIAPVDLAAGDYSAKLTGPGTYGIGVNYASTAGSIASNAVNSASIVDYSIAPVDVGAGTYGINISGNAGTATSATTAGNITGQGSLATLSSINNSNWSGAALAIPNGGTGAITAANARTNLGLGPLAILGSTNISQLTNDSGYLTSLNGVTTTNISDGTITPADVGPGTYGISISGSAGTAGTISGQGALATKNTVGSADLADFSVTNLKMASNSVNSAAISDGTIVPADLYLPGGLFGINISGSAGTAGTITGQIGAANLTLADYSGDLKGPGTYGITVNHALLADSANSLSAGTYGINISGSATDATASLAGVAAANYARRDWTNTFTDDQFINDAATTSSAVTSTPVHALHIFSPSTVRNMLNNTVDKNQLTLESPDGKDTLLMNNTLSTGQANIIFQGPSASNAGLVGFDHLNNKLSLQSTGTINVTDGNDSDGVGPTMTFHHGEINGADKIGATQLCIGADCRPIWPSGGVADNLGNHTATQTLAMSGFGITGAGAITGTSFSGAGTGLTGTAASLSIGGNAATATSAGNVTGTVAIGNGGTGATTAANARTNLGLGALATIGAVSGGAAGTITDGTITAADLLAGDFSTKINSGTYSIGISGTANYATSAGDSATMGGIAAANYARLDLTGTQNFSGTVNFPTDTSLKVVGRSVCLSDGTNCPGTVLSAPSCQSAAGSTSSSTFGWNYGGTGDTVCAAKGMICTNGTFNPYNGTPWNSGCGYTGDSSSVGTANCASVFTANCTSKTTFGWNYGGTGDTVCAAKGMTCTSGTFYPYNGTPWSSGCGYTGDSSSVGVATCTKTMPSSKTYAAASGGYFTGQSCGGSNHCILNSGGCNNASQGTCVDPYYTPLNTTYPSAIGPPFTGPNCGTDGASQLKCLPQDTCQNAASALCLRNK